MTAQLVDATVGLPMSLRAETPATQAGSEYCWVPVSALGLPAGPLSLLVLLGSLLRPRGQIELTAAECARSLGCCERSLRYWRRALEAAGWLPAGSLVLQRRSRFRKGYRARIDTRKLAVLSPASVRAYVAVALATRDGVRQQVYAAIARRIGRSRQALWAALKPVRLLGLRVADRAQHRRVAAVRQVTAADAGGARRRGAMRGRHARRLAALAAPEP